MILGRFLAAALIVTAGLAAPAFQDSNTPIYVIIQTMLSYFQGPTLAILLLGILWRRTTGWGGLAGLVLGVASTVSLSAVGEDIFPSGDPFLFVAFWSFLFSLAVTIAVSLITPREPDEKLRGLVYGSVMQDESAQELLKRRVEGDL